MFSFDCGLGAGGSSSARETPSDACACEQIGAGNAKRASKIIETAYCFGFIGRAFQTLGIEISSVLVIRTVQGEDSHAAEFMAERKFSSPMQLA